MSLCKICLKNVMGHFCVSFITPRIYILFLLQGTVSSHILRNNMIHGRTRSSEEIRDHVEYPEPLTDGPDPFHYIFLKTTTTVDTTHIIITPSKMIVEHGRHKHLQPRTDCLLQVKNCFKI